MKRYRHDHTLEVVRSSPGSALNLLSSSHSILHTHIHIIFGFLGVHDHCFHGAAVCRAWSIANKSAQGQAWVSSVMPIQVKRYDIRSPEESKEEPAEAEVVSGTEFVALVASLASVATEEKLVAFTSSVQQYIQTYGAASWKHAAGVNIRIDVDLQETGSWLSHLMQTLLEMRQCSSISLSPIPASILRQAQLVRGIAFPLQMISRLTSLSLTSIREPFEGGSPSTLSSSSSLSSLLAPLDSVSMCIALQQAKVLSRLSLIDCHFKPFDCPATVTELTYGGLAADPSSGDYRLYRAGVASCAGVLCELDVPHTLDVSDEACHRLIAVSIRGLAFYQTELHRFRGMFSHWNNLHRLSIDFNVDGFGAEARTGAVAIPGFPERYPTLTQLCMLGVAENHLSFFHNRPHILSRLTVFQWRPQFRADPTVMLTFFGTEFCRYNLLKLFIIQDLCCEMSRHAAYDASTRPVWVTTSNDGIVYHATVAPSGVLRRTSTAIHELHLPSGTITTSKTARINASSIINVFLQSTSRTTIVVLKSEKRPTWLEREIDSVDPGSTWFTPANCYGRDCLCKTHS